MKAFLYTNNETSETEMREKIPFVITTRTIKYLRINLIKQVKDLYSENYTTLNKETKEDINKWKHIPCHVLEGLASSKCPYSLKKLMDSMRSLLKYQ